jgi:hypothetical protein
MTLCERAKRIAEYLSSAPAISSGGETWYVWLDSVRVVRSPGPTTFQVGYHLTKDRRPVDFSAILAAKPRGLRSSEEPDFGPYYSGGFSTRHEFEAAKDLFEESARSLLRLGQN